MCVGGETAEVSLNKEGSSQDWRGDALVEYRINIMHNWKVVVQSKLTVKACGLKFKGDVEPGCLL